MSLLPLNLYMAFLRNEQQLRAIAKREGNPAAALRVVVESGGCHGYQYKLHLARERQPDD